MSFIYNIEQLRELAWAFRASRVLQVANKLEVFTKLSRGPLTAREVAEQCESDLEMTEKLLIACTALGLTRFEDGKYWNSDIANVYLVKGKTLLPRKLDQPRVRPLELCARENQRVERGGR